MFVVRRDTSSSIEGLQDCWTETFGVPNVLVSGLVDLAEQSNPFIEALKCIQVGHIVTDGFTEVLEVFQVTHIFGINSVSLDELIKTITSRYLGVAFPGFKDGREESIPNKILGYRRIGCNQIESVLNIRTS